MKARLGCWLLLALGALPMPAADKVDFARDIQPIFASRCYECHGERKQKSGFRLDDRAVVLRGGESAKPAVTPSSSATSHLIQLVTHPDAAARMPRHAEPLSAPQIALLRAWIDQGANWPDALSRTAKPHWAFIAPQRPAVPKVQSASLQPQNPVDNFVLVKLAQEKLKPSPEADKLTLLRRLHLDLTGLPPTIAEVEAYLADKSKDAYAKQVERLLASPHYGERWGRHWLDAARYADSDGYEKDMSREQWPYRDYVINAFNRDVPYDRFIVEQLAGDLLPGRTLEQVAATGFLRNSMVNMEGAIDPEQFRMDAMFDRMMRVHLYGTFYCTREALPRMRAQGEGGRIVNMGSIMGTASLQGAPDYCAAKGAILAFTRATAREAASYGVLVNALAPGFIDTPLLEPMDDAQKRLIALQTPLARLGEADEIAAAALFLAGPDSTFVTGQVLSPNGGIHMSQ